MDMEASLEAAFKDVPENEDTENAAAELIDRRSAGAENFIVLLFCFVLFL